MKPTINFDRFYSIRPKTLNDFADIINPVTGMDFKCNDDTLCSFAEYLNIFPDDRKDCYNKTWEIFLIKCATRTIGITGYYILKDMPKIPWLTWFGVINQYQKCGIGSFILDQTFRFVKKHYNADYMYVYCIDDVIDFYIKNGFKLMGKAKDLNMMDKCESETDNVLSFDLNTLNMKNNENRLLIL